MGDGLLKKEEFAPALAIFPKVPISTYEIENFAEIASPFWYFYDVCATIQPLYC